MFCARINNEIEYNFSGSMLLSDILIAAGMNFPLPCGGNGTCGKCKVAVIGSLTPLSSEEVKKLTALEIEENIRLACISTAIGDVEISCEIADIHVETSGYSKDFVINNDYKSGIVIDIGTTTIAAKLYKNSQVVKTVTGLNEQSKFGADVISRIDYTITNGKEALFEAITMQLSGMIDRLGCQNPDIMVITGNTTMLHFLTNLEAKGIAVSPFIPESLFGGYYNIMNKNTYIPRCVSAYVGADITCGILAAGMLEKNETSILVDMGTNGEMAYYDNDGILKTASTAAGPAFEGAGIFMGMPAKAGAINKVYVENGEIKYTTINGEKPIGICGSGLIDCIAVMVKEGILDETGIINDFDHNHIDLITEHEDKPAFNISDSGVIITSKDIRQIQLAKSAISAGIMTLLDDKTVDTLYIAGGFGAYISIENAEMIGLIPKGVYKETKILGNSAITGAGLIFLSSEEREKSEKIAEIAVTTELSSNPEFMDYYVENMFF